MPERQPAPRGWNSIGNKLLAGLVAVAVLPTVAVAVYAMRKGSDVLVDHALYRLLDNTSASARLVQDSLKSLRDDLPVITKDAHARRIGSVIVRPIRQGTPTPLKSAEYNTFRADLDWLERKIKVLLQGHDGCVSIQAIVGGALLMRVERQSGAVRQERAVRVEFDAQNRPMRLVRNPPPKRTQDQRIDRALTQAIGAHPERLIQRVTLPASLGSGDALEVFAVQMRNLDDRTTGYLLVTLSWSKILGDLVASTTPLATTRDSVRCALFTHELEPVEFSRNLEVELPPHLMDRARYGNAGAALTEGDQIVSFAPLAPSEGGGDDFLVLAFSRSLEVLADVDRFRFVFSAVLIGALLLALALGTVLSRRLTRPLRQVRDGARRIGSGDLEQSIELDTRDEVAEVAAEFNAMARRLHSLYMGLEETIRERTEQLQQALDEARTAHNRLLESEARYSEIVENASDLIQVTDQERRVISVNRRQAEILQQSAEELRGRDFLEFIAPDLRDATRSAFESVLMGRTLTAYQSALIVECDGRRVPVEISATPMMKNGSARGVRAILRDVSERKAMESQLIKAERLSSVGALAAGVAHEINNPLGIITMFAQRTLERARCGEIDIAKLEKIVTQARRVAQITTGLLDFSRSGPTDFREFSVSDAVKDTVTLISERARRNAIELCQELAPDLPPVFGNPQQIEQVLLNLLLNALQAVQRDGTITIRSERIKDSRLPGGRSAVRVSVEDSGPGIPSESLSRLFEPFFTTKSPGEGTGLGLSVSYGILKDHNGLLWAENGPQGGARFRFELPLQET